MRNHLVPVLLSLCILGLAGAALAAQQPAAPTAPLEFKGAKKTVMFPHAPHAKVECVVCHHMVNGEASFQKCATAGCHDDLTGRKGEKSLYFVVHNKGEGLRHQTCLACHARVAEQTPDLKKALTGCSKSKCHP
ncbi:cytochrome c3 family protein [uncultured Desulfovibrio sp.]|uniref:cytochrome c3 family protein n=1 Tax=uncultured Desulfovibrio sp. TaxID=167968 RepID=UPI0025DFB542|nr:cytochrome c3 family protein [uncultured Desulfovibrio sp.]